jgi:hypothetical protein
MLLNHTFKYRWECGMDSDFDSVLYDFYDTIYGFN